MRCASGQSIHCGWSMAWSCSLGQQSQPPLTPTLAPPPGAQTAQMGSGPDWLQTLIVNCISSLVTSWKDRLVLKGHCKP